jgi:hypothetical protein
VEKEYKKWSTSISDDTENHQLQPMFLQQETLFFPRINVLKTTAPFAPALT